ncbi:MAG TPA: tetratricopeptide repeat protein, partial [Terriglobales bacterium]|nr:tetratricopeptide repeat protein [Terriglobales bacterium]
LNQLPKAEYELEKALELAPNNAHLHYELAQVYQREGQAEKAKGEFDRYTAIGAQTARKPNR